MRGSRRLVVATCRYLRHLSQRALFLYIPQVCGSSYILSIPYKHRVHQYSINIVYFLFFLLLQPQPNLHQQSSLSLP